MALVVPGITRFAVNATLATRPVVNIIDLQIDTTGTALSRAEANEAAAGNIINAWKEHVLPLVSDQYVFQSVSWVDLDSATGDTGARTSTSTTTLPDPGNVIETPVPSNTSILVTKSASTGRGQRNGRMYVAGAPDASVQTNNLQPLATWQAAFSALLTEVNDEPLTPVNFDRTWSVVHTVGPNPTTGTFTPVQSLAVQQRVATQRRRLR